MSVSRQKHVSSKVLSILQSYRFNCMKNNITEIEEHNNIIRILCT